MPLYLPNLTRHMVMKHNSAFYKYFYKTFEVCSFNVHLKAEVYNEWFEHAVVPRNKQAFAHEAINIPSSWFCTTLLHIAI